MHQRNVRVFARKDEFLGTPGPRTPSAAPRACTPSPRPAPGSATSRPRSCRPRARGRPARCSSVRLENSSVRTGNSPTFRRDVQEHATRRVMKLLGDRAAADGFVRAPRLLEARRRAIVALVAAAAAHRPRRDLAADVARAEHRGRLSLGARLGPRLAPTPRSRLARGRRRSGVSRGASAASAVRVLALVRCLLWRSPGGCLREMSLRPAPLCRGLEKLRGG